MPAQNICENCGGFLDENGLCPYCGRKYIPKTEAKYTYPTVRCTSAKLNFWNFVFPLIFAVMFGSFSVVFINGTDMTRGGVSVWYSAPFIAIAIGALLFALYSVCRMLLVVLFGISTTGVVAGYQIDNSVLVNGKPCMLAEIQTETDKEKKMLLYQTYNPFETFSVGTQVNLRMYLNMIIISVR